MSAGGAVDAAPVVVGLDLGGTKILAASAGVKAGAPVLAEERAATRADDAVALVEQLAALVERVAAGRPIAAIGLGTVGVPEESTGVLLEAPNLVGVDRVPVLHLLADRIGRPLAVENDVNAAALGEAESRGERDFVVIAAGTGVGAGIVLDGRLWRGVGGRAGEIAFLPFGTDPLEAGNRIRGPFEEAVAGRTLRDRYRVAGGTAEGHADVLALATAGDAAAATVLDDLASTLARGIVAIDAVLDPGLVVLTGGLGARAETVERTRAALARFGADRIRVEASRSGERAGVLGALRAARELAVGGAA